MHTHTHAVIARQCKRPISRHLNAMRTKNHPRIRLAWRARKHRSSLSPTGISSLVVWAILRAYSLFRWRARARSSSPSLPHSGHMPNRIAQKLKCLSTISVPCCVLHGRVIIFRFIESKYGRYHLFGGKFTFVIALTRYVRCRWSLMGPGPISAASGNMADVGARRADAFFDALSIMWCSSFA